MMSTIAIIMNFLGRKISYNYILYNASVTFGAGVIFFLAKIILTIEVVGQIEQIIDLVITLLLIIVWFVSLIETLIIEVMENGHAWKGNIQFFVMKVKMMDLDSIKRFPSRLLRFGNYVIDKVQKSIVIVFNKRHKLFDVFSKGRELNKKV